MHSVYTRTRTCSGSYEYKRCCSRVLCNRVCSQGDALRHSLLTLYLGASYNQGLAGPSPAIANASAHGPPAAPSPDKDSPDAKGGGISLAIRNDLSLVETQVSVERLTSYS